MTRSKDRIYVGVGGHVVALDTATGHEIWRTKLKGTSFTTVWEANRRVYGGASGELFCLDPATGSILWHNRLKGLGMGVVAFAGSAEQVAGAAAEAANAAAASAT